MILWLVLPDTFVLYLLQIFNGQFCVWVKALSNEFCSEILKQQYPRPIAPLNLGVKNQSDSFLNLLIVILTVNCINEYLIGLAVAGILYIV